MARSLADDLSSLRGLVERGESLSLPSAEALLWIDCIAAAEQWRSIVTAPIATDMTYEDRTARSHACLAAKQAEFIALSALATHVTQRGDTLDGGLKADRSRENAVHES